MGHLWFPIVGALIVCVCNVSSTIVWRRTMDNEKIEENMNLGEFVYTLEAVQVPASPNSPGLIYGFNNKEDSNIDIETYGNYFRINRTSGQVYTYGNKLDFEAVSNRDFKINIIARTVDGSDYNKRTSTLVVLDTNDEKPKFANDSLSVFIDENTDVGTGFVALQNILITDLDTIITPPQRFLEADIQYCIVAGVKVGCDADFDLVQTGVLSPKTFTANFVIKRPLDFERASKIQVQLVAEDGNSNNTITTDVVVNVRDVQDLPPRWIEIPSSVFVNDGTRTRGMTVKVEAEDQDSQKRDIYYTLMNTGNEGKFVEDVFEIDSLTGIITNIIPLDLEDEEVFRDYANKLVRREWPLSLMACEIISNGPPRQVGTGDMVCAPLGTVNIIINDINDNKPTFNLDQYTYIILENIPNGQVLSVPEIQIVDRDTDIFNTYENRLEIPSKEFDITGKTNRFPAIVIKDTTLIDYDNGPKEYSLKLITSDMQNPNFSSTAMIKIIVVDVNDNPPVFVGRYRVSIPEDSKVSHPVVTVKATDLDSEDFGNKSIMYELSGSYENLFTINEQTGEVTVAECRSYGVDPCLDYDIQPTSYELYVTAIDNYGKAGNQRDTIVVTVDVLDVNDNGPTVGDYRRYITEGETKFNPELFVQGQDKDNQTLYYSIEAQYPGNFWDIDRNTGRIFVNKGGKGIKFLDGLAQGTGGSSFQLEVIVTDNKFEARSNVEIIVIDVNDNAPQFFPSIYNITIDETTKGGTFLLSVSATDTDDSTSQNGIIEYILASGNTGGRFKVINKTGEVFVSNGATFDYDRQKRYEMLVFAVDQGRPQLTGNATVIVNIRDANNKNPSIDPGLQEFTVYDNVAIGHLVGIVGASDPDVDAIINFLWGPDENKEANSDEGFKVNATMYDYRDLFTIDPSTGRIYTNKKLDSRRASLVRYEVIVKDVRPDPEQTGFGTVIFNIKPFNTKPPVFEPYDSPIYIDEEQAIGSGVITLMAQDDNGIRLFEIVEQPDYNFFAMSPTTGSVSILRRIDYDDSRMINGSYFIATVTDTGDPELTATATVSVIFRNINDNYPEFVERDNIDRPRSIYTSRIEENSADGTPIATVFAFDRDRPDNNTFNEVRYYMNDNRFDVDPITGQIVVRLRNGAVLDRETNPRINTEVIARDNPNGTPQNQRAAAVIVTLTDVNDNPPKFSRDEYYVQIFETIGVDTDILQLFSTDRDIGDNARSYYSKILGVGTDTGDFFDVRREAGRIYLKNSVLRHVGRYTFYVQAQDLFGTGFRTNATVIVDVLPSANSPPIWVIPPIDNMTIYVLEEQYNGMVVYDVSARDEDSGINGIVDYSFIYDGETTQSTPDFKINKVTGVIQAEIVYDRELVDRYVLLLNASDRGETRLGTTRFLTVIVLDVNDNAPRFADSEIEIRIAENRPLGEIKKIPTATDLDLDPVIVYNIISGNEEGTFELDPDTRMLYLRRPLDREVKSIYYLDVQASNNEADYTVIRNRKRRAIDPSIITVKILVGDINDEAPRFLQDEYYGCVSARAPFEKHIMTVQAIDRDAIGTGVVRYQVTNGHMVGNTTLFGIHPKFGIVTNRVLMRRYADSTFYITINARDREDIDTAESSEAVAKIFVNQPGNEVKLLITQNTGEVRLYQSQIQNILEQAEELDYVCINDIQDHVIDSAGSVSTLWSDVYVTGIRRSVVDGQERHRILSSTEFMNIINTERYARKSDFDLLYIREVEAASSSNEIELEDQAVLIILVIIAVLIFLVIIFCILAFMCIRASKRHKKERLLHKTHATPPPMMEQAPMVVEPILYDNSMFVQEEPQPIQVVEEHSHVEHDPVHVQYAVVQKRSPSPQYVEQSVHQYVEDDQEAIVVELKDDEPGSNDVYNVESEYRIETDLVTDAERF